MMRLHVLGLFGLLIALQPAAAQESERYRLERTEDGYVRMDTETGRMALCQERSGQLVCQMAAEDRDAFEDDVAGLRRKVEELEGRVSALEKNVGTPLRVLPNEEEFDRSLSMMEKFFRRFMGVIQDLEKPEAPTDRT